MMTKDEALKEAKRLGIKDYEKMKWSELSSAVAKAKAKEKKPTTTEDEVAKLKRELAEEKARNKQYQIKYENRDDGDRPTREELHGLPIIISPEIQAQSGREQYPAYMFEEELNNDVILKEDVHRPGDIAVNNINPGDYLAGGITNQGYTKNKVISTTGGPRENAGQIWNPDELFATVLYRGQEHYRWSHVYSLLSQCEGGIYLDKYHDEIYGTSRSKGRLKSTGLLLVIDKPFVNNIITEIENNEKKKMIANAREKKFLEELENE